MVACAFKGVWALLWTTLLCLACTIQAQPGRGHHGGGHSGNDDHVCHYQHWVTGYEQRSETFTCFTTNYERTSRRNCNYRYCSYVPVTELCVRYVETTCVRTWWECTGYWEDVAFCCPGYTYDEDNDCVDIDNPDGTVSCGGTPINGGCAHHCNPLADSDETKCWCSEGYQVDPEDYTQCIDVNECAAYITPCDYDCFNVEGSFYCECPTGFILTDKTTCQDIDECADSNGGCEHTCTNTQGAFTCFCDAGFVVDEDDVLGKGLGCVDVDECLVDNGECEHICENMHGGYECSCQDGFVEDYDVGSGKGCVDVDECLGYHRCSHECINAEGGFTCTCPNPEQYYLDEDERTCIKVELPNIDDIPFEPVTSGEKDALIGGLVFVLLLVCGLVAAVVLFRRYGCCCCPCLFAAAVKKDNKSAGNGYEVPIVITDSKPPPPYTGLGYDNNAYDVVGDAIKKTQMLDVTALPPYSYAGGEVYADVEYRNGHPANIYDNQDYVTKKPFDDGDADSIAKPPMEEYDSDVATPAKEEDQLKYDNSLESEILNVKKLLRSVPANNQ